MPDVSVLYEPGGEGEVKEVDFKEGDAGAWRRIVLGPRSSLTLTDAGANSPVAGKSIRTGAWPLTEMNPVQLRGER